MLTKQKEKTTRSLPALSFLSLSLSSSKWHNERLKVIVLFLCYEKSTISHVQINLYLLIVRILIVQKIYGLFFFLIDECFVSNLFAFLSLIF
jgi:hypothetical protein